MLRQTFIKRIVFSCSGLCSPESLPPHYCENHPFHSFTWNNTLINICMTLCLRMYAVWGSVNIHEYLCIYGDNSPPQMGLWRWNATAEAKRKNLRRLFEEFKWRHEWTSHAWHFQGVPILPYESCALWMGVSRLTITSFEPFHAW